MQTYTYALFSIRIHTSILELKKKSLFFLLFLLEIIDYFAPLLS